MQHLMRTYVLAVNTGGTNYNGEKMSFVSKANFSQN